MTQQELELLKIRSDDPKVDAKPLKITTCDGEVLVAFVRYVDDEYLDVTYDVVQTNMPERYAANPGAAFVIPISQIAMVQGYQEEG